MLTFTYSKENVESQLRQNVDDLIKAFSSYDLFSEEERTEHTHSTYVPKSVGIASHLDALAEHDEGLRDVRVLARLFRSSSQIPSVCMSSLSKGPCPVSSIAPMASSGFPGAPIFLVIMTSSGR